jgi:hypothetical protein
MIRVTKVAKPAILVEREVAWTNEYLEALAAGGPISDTIRYRYRHPEVKATIRLEAFGKCVYCETKIPVGETDHFNPVASFPEQIVRWENLVLACKECNTNKGDYSSQAEPLINPSTEDPLQDIYFFGPMVMPRGGSLKGFRTIRRLKLGRTELFQERTERIEKLRPLIEEWRAQPDGETKDMLRQAILEEGGSDKEFCALVRAYIYQECGW